MPEYDAGFKIVARHAGRALTRVAGVTCDRWQPVVDTLQAATERLADRAFLAQQGDVRFVVYMEAYTRWDPDAPWNALAKSGLLSERERAPTLCLFFVLTPRGFQSAGGEFRLSLPGRPTQALWFQEVCLWQVVPESWWDNHPGLMALLPLCRHEKTVAQAVAHAATKIQKKEKAVTRRADLLTILGIFGRLADRDTDVVSIIGREQMKESPFYQELVLEGELKRAREYVLQVLRIRFGEDAVKASKPAVEAIDDLARLNELHRQAVASRRFSQFRRTLAPNGA